MEIKRNKPENLLEVQKPDPRPTGSIGLSIQIYVHWNFFDRTNHVQTAPNCPKVCFFLKFTLINFQEIMNNKSLSMPEILNRIKQT